MRRALSSLAADAAPPRKATMRRVLSSLTFDAVPPHLSAHIGLKTSMQGRCMIIGRPLWKYPLAVVPPEPTFAPLLSAIRGLESSMRPFRIVTHEDTAGNVFNASFFTDEANMNNWLEWLKVNALDPAGEFHTCLAPSAAESSALPTRETLLFGEGHHALADTRFGEFQLGMTARYSRYVLRDAEMRAEAAAEAASAEYEQRIADCMQAHGVSYFGRLVMEAPAAEAEGGDGVFLTMARFGSLDDAERGVAAVREMLAPEMARWFRQEETIMGTASRVLEL